MEAYESVGGVLGALANEAEAARNWLTPDDQARLESVFVRLVWLGDTGGATRRTAALDEFDDARRDLVQRLGKDEFGRLVVVGETSAEIAHEALITQWPWLQGRLRDDARDVRRLDRLMEKAQEWREATADRKAAYLATGAERESFDELARQRADWLSSLDRDFVEASNRAYETERANAAASLLDVRRLVLKHGNSFGVFDNNGDAISAPGSAEGLYHRDTRHLSNFVVTVERARPMLLSSTLRDDNAMLTCDLINRDLFEDPNHLKIEHDLIHLRRTRFLWQAACFERLSIRNCDDRRHRIQVGIAFAADFADLFEVRGANRKRRGEAKEPEIDETGVTLSYVGLDKQRRSTTLRFDPKPTKLSADRATYMLDLDPRESLSIFIKIDCREEDSALLPLRGFFIGLRDARRELRASSSRAASIDTSNDIFNEAARRSIADLYMLMTRAARRALSLRRHSLVQRGLRARRA